MDAREFVNGDLASIYWSEVLFQTDKIIELCEEIFRTCDKRDEVNQEGYLITVDAELHQKIYNILNVSANISKMIRPHVGKRNKKEHIETYKKRVERRKFFDMLLKDVNIEHIHNKASRNSLEHFDERIDEYSHLLRSKYGRESVGIYNMTISSREAFSFKLLPLRLYISDEKLFLIFNNETHLNKIYEEAKTINKLFKKVFFDNKETEYSGAMIFLEKK